MVMQPKAAKVRARHDAEIQYLKLMAEGKAKGIMERLDFVENTNSALEVGLEEQSGKLAHVTIELGST
ncbi:hypothetical protein CORC01_06583 [Colletotrichum orchidophilum]|uniref:Uncharacterized protein n=1 Tax=Colletotrichum orchidophilum TaxID=1209926 RepID=A0A1G4B9J8_9PEZI|nr:uncharacterized protein CORC01_06583 [Colletotrichum orchidophilum]OHE98069.1 hypothetical protein CORC01_06583 [Colletotrichum orchidophilum]